MPRVFISYRRGDSADVTGRIDDRLITAFGRKNVFKDVDSIPLGTDFRKYLSKAVGKCDVLLVVIGKDWLSTVDERGTRRLDDDADYVRIEVETALHRNIPVVPLLVLDADMPKADELPPSMSDLAYRNATRVRPDPDFGPDMDRIIRAIQDLPADLLDSSIRPAARSKPDPKSRRSNEPKGERQAAGQRRVPADTRSRDTAGKRRRDNTGPRTSATAAPAGDRHRQIPSARLAEAGSAAVPRQTRTEQPPAATTKRTEVSQAQKPGKGSVGRTLFWAVTLLCLAGIPATVMLIPELKEKAIALFNGETTNVAIEVPSGQPETAETETQQTTTTETPLPTTDSTLAGASGGVISDDNEVVANTSPGNTGNDMSAGPGSRDPVEKASFENTTDNTAGTSEESSAATVMHALGQRDAIPDPDAAPKVLKGTVFNDRNGNRTRDADERGIPNLTVQVTDSSGEVHAGTTDEEGAYQLPLVGDSNVVTVDRNDPDLPAGSMLTTGEPQPISATAGTPRPYDIGFQQLGVVFGTVFNDRDGNGVQDEGEDAIANIDVAVTTADGNLLELTTNKEGQFFADVSPGKTIVKVDAADSDFPAGSKLQSGGTRAVLVTAGSESPAHVAFQQFGMLLGRVFLDQNGNGRPDDGEPRLAGIGVSVTSEVANKQVQTSDSEGYFEFSLPRGVASVSIDPNDAKLPDGAAVTSIRESIVVKPDMKEEADIGFRQFGTLEGTVFNDSNGNGVLNQDETGISGVGLIVTDNDDNVKRFPTDQKGHFELSLPVGAVLVSVDRKDPMLPRGAMPTLPSVKVLLKPSTTEKYDIGFQQQGTVVGLIFNDTNANRRLDKDEIGIPGVEVRVSSSDKKSRNAITNDKGVFTASVSVGAAMVEVTKTGSTLPGDIAFMNSEPTRILVEAGSSSTADIGLLRLVRLAGTVFHDVDGNGRKDAGEPGIPKIPVIVRNSVRDEQTVFTDAAGAYAHQVPAGETVVIVDTAGAGPLLAGMFPSRPQPKSLMATSGSELIAWHGFRMPEGLVWIPPGEFTMGNPQSRSDDLPHPVSLTQGFYLAKYEVTQAQFQTVMGKNPSTSKADPNQPVESVAWEDAMNYCAELTKIDQRSGKLPRGFEYVLPTEAQWEYACRAGTNHETYGQPLNAIAWYELDDHPRPVGQKAPNPWGLYDMIGNVSEWCLDRYGPYDRKAVVDPVGPATGGDRVIRGADYYSGRAKCRASFRHHLSGVNRGTSQQTGFRVAAVLRKP